MNTSVMLRNRKLYPHSRNEDLDCLKGLYQDGRNRVMVLTDSFARIILVPRKKDTVQDEATDALIETSTYQSLLSVKKRPTLQNKQAYVKELMENNVIREQNMKEKIEPQNQKKIRISESDIKLKREDHVRKKHLIRRAKALLKKEEEEIKKMNSKIARAQQGTILRKQIEQNILRKKMEKEKGIRQGKDMLEKNVAQYDESQRIQIEKARETNRNYLKWLQTQIKINEEEKHGKKLEEIENEVADTNFTLALQAQADMKRIKKEEEKSRLRKFLKDSIQCNQLLKMKRAREDRVIEEQLEQMRQLQDDRAKQAVEKMNKRTIERDEVCQANAKKIKEEYRLRTEAEEFAQRIRTEKVENEWRRKEIERVTHELNRKRSFLDGIKQQQNINIKKNAELILHNIQDHEKIAN